MCYELKDFAQLLHGYTRRGHKLNFWQPQVATWGYSHSTPSGLCVLIDCAWDKPVPESIAIIGPKRSGKTSLLNYLIHISRASQLRADQPKGWPDGWLPRAFNAILNYGKLDMPCIFNDMAVLNA